MDKRYRKKIGVLLDRIDGKFYLVYDYNAFELNEVGARIFDLCDGKNLIMDIVDKLANFYKVDKDGVQSDVTEYLNQLLRAEVIEEC